MKRHNCHGFLVFVLIAVSLLIFVDDAYAEWVNHGGGITNRRQATNELLINPLTARNYLHLRWNFFAGRDISATPAVATGIVYFPSWNGNIYAVNAITGNLIWKQNLLELTIINGTGRYVNTTVSRTTPMVSDELLIFGIYGPAVVFAVNRLTGRLVWSTKLDPHPFALITQSGTVYNRELYIGVSSLEETASASTCCTFRGSLAKLNVRSGAIIWQTYMVPDNGGKIGGYAGAAVWGSSPAIDITRRRVYIATGKLYIAPEDVLECQERQNNQTTPSEPDKCIGPDVNANAILALNIDSGKVAWSRSLGGYDVFYFACLIPNNPDCPPGPNVDADFGESPMLLSINSNGTRRDVAVAVQKSGFAWALDRDNGSIVWFKLAGPGSREGGGIWGASTDGARVYTNIANADRVTFTLAPSTRTTNAGAWVALDANSGNILWSTANSSNDTSHGPVTLANGLLFAGSMAPNGPFYAIDTRNGNILWSYNTNASVYGGAAVSYGCVYVGSGYKVGLANFHPTWTSGTSLFAFCVY